MRRQNLLYYKNATLLKNILSFFCKTVLQMSEIVQRLYNFVDPLKTGSVAYHGLLCVILMFDAKIFYTYCIYVFVSKISCLNVIFFILSGGSCCQPRASSHNHIRRIFHIQHGKFLGFFSCKISHRLLNYLNKKEICNTYKCTNLLTLEPNSILSIFSQNILSKLTDLYRIGLFSYV